VELLFGAIAALADDAEGPRYELVLIGDGRAAAELDALARDLGITDRIHRLGFIGDRSTYLAALRTADLFVFPSPAEGFPKVVLDAMAVGLPVVARPVGGVAPLVGSGIVAEAPTGSHALAAAVSRLVADPDRAAVIRAAGQRFVRMHTRSAELERIVAGWQARWPALPW
jgi:glycosyltransferase involved in cell wall biosynthesis